MRRSLAATVRPPAPRRRSAVRWGALLLALVWLGSTPGAARQDATAEDAPGAASGAGPLAEADRAFAARAVRDESADGGWRADPAALERALEAYREAVETAPDDLRARRGLLHALYFQGEHLASGADARREVFDRGKSAAEEALARLAGAADADPESFRELAPEERATRLRAAGVPAEDAAALYFWSGVHWGLWGDAYGRFAAAREGVAGTVRDDARTALTLAPTVERAGPHRVLGRLHAEAPKIPFFTGWVDRERAIAELERAVELAPDEPLNRIYLAEALLAHRPGRREDALAQLRAVRELPVEPPRAVETDSAREHARRLLEEGAR